MKIHNTEIRDGLASLLEEDLISYAASLTMNDKDADKSKDKAAIAVYLENRLEQFDLFWLESILASSGWNENDDIFTPEEIWAARNTPVHKPINFMHKPDEIIGHMVDSVAVDRESNIIPSYTTVDHLPDDFDIVVSGVLYRLWAEKENDDKVIKLINEIYDGLWSVSMECRFTHFDYGLWNIATGEKTIVERNDETSFLTKFLRFYGGEGVWQGYKIGRVLRNLTFVGKGIVNKPGNKRSVILSAHSNMALASLDELTKTQNEGTSQMADNNDKTLEAVEKAYASQLDAVTKRLEDAERAYAEKIETFKDSLEKTTANLQSSEKSVAELTQELQDVKAALANEQTARAKEKEDMEKEKDEKAKALEDATAALETLQSQVAQIAEEKAKAERLNLLTQAGFEAEAAEKLMGSFASLSDDQFKTLVPFLSDKNTASASEVDFDSATAEKSKRLNPPKTKQPKWSDLASAVAQSIEKINGE